MDELTRNWQEQLGRELSAAVVALNLPSRLTADDLKRVAEPFLLRYLKRAACRRQLGDKLKGLGYERHANPDHPRGRWCVKGRQMVVYRLAGS